MKSLSRVQLLETPRTDYSLPGSSVHRIFQARILEWAAISFSRRSSRPRDWTSVSRIVGRHFTVCATREFKEHWPKQEDLKTWDIERFFSSNLANQIKGSVQVAHNGQNGGRTCKLGDICWVFSAANLYENYIYYNGNYSPYLWATLRHTEHPGV